MNTKILILLAALAAAAEAAAGVTGPAPVTAAGGAAGNTAGSAAGNVAGNAAAVSADGAAQAVMPTVAQSPSQNATQNATQNAGPVVVSGTVGDDAAKATLLARLRATYGAGRVVDQLAVGRVTTPPNWNEHVARLVGPNLKLVSRGQLQVDGTSISLRGDVASEAQRQQVAGELAQGLDAGYTVNNGLRVVASEQGLLDATLANRIIEFDSGKATLADSGKAILDQMSAVLVRLKDKRVEVIGHTDNAGSRAGNLSLSQARAETVKLYVSAHGVNPDMIAMSGEGPDRPVADNRTPDGRARNRRIEFKIVQ